MFSSNTSQVAATATAAEAVDFDGTNDYLSRSTDLTGNANGKTVTLSFWVWIPTGASQGTIYAGGYSTYYGLNVYFNGGYINVEGARETFGSGTLSWSTPLLPFNTWINIVLSFDLSNAALRHSYINDQQGGSYGTYSNFNLFLAQPNHYVGRQNAPAYYAKARISNLFLDYTYRDLSIEANRRLFITADLEPAAGQAALNPILYLPMSNPTTVGTNAGTGGNFTLTGTIARSGRGPNQYNAPYSDLDGTADYLSRTTALTGIADGKTFTLSFCFNKDSASNKYPFTIYSSTTKRFRAIVDSGGYITIEASSSAGTGVLFVSSSAGSIALNRNYVITVSVDLTDTAKRHFYINGSAATATWSTYSNTDIDFSPTTPSYYAGYDANPANFWDGRLGALWFNTSYIDLSQPANLAKFVTGTGINAKPVDLGATGELPTGTSPLIYLPMYGNNAGKNYGTGGDFTVNSGPYTGARGPNEYWGNKMRTTVSSYVGRTSAMTGVANGKKFSCSFFVSQGQAAGGRVLSLVGNTGDNTEYLMIDIDVDGNFSIYGYNSSQVNILALPNMPFGGTATLANVYHVLIAVDLSTSSYQIYVNNVNKSPSGGIVLTNDNIKFDGGRPSVGAGPVASGNAGDKSEFYFTTEYIDFSQEANRLKFRDAFGNPVNLTQQIEDAAIPNPAIYMRFPPTAFGTNYGTGGNFTVNGTITDGGQL